MAHMRSSIMNLRNFARAAGFIGNRASRASSLASSRVSSRLGGREDGFAVVVALTVIVVIVGFATLWLQIGEQEVRSASVLTSREQAGAAAEAGINLAMSALSADPLSSAAAQGSAIAPIALPQGAGSYFVEVADGAAPLSRVITATGYAGGVDGRQVVRKTQHTVQLIPLGIFDHAIFATTGGISGTGFSLLGRVVGNVYSQAAITLPSMRLEGSLRSRGDITTSWLTSVIGGPVESGRNVTISGLTFLPWDANVTATGNITKSFFVRINGNLRAGGTISSCARVSGTCVAGPPAPAAPPLLQLPTYTMPVSAVNYTTLTAAQKQDLQGTYYCPAACTLSTAGGAGREPWLMTGDTTIIANGQLTVNNVSADQTSEDFTLRVISVSNADPALQVTGSFGFRFGGSQQWRTKSLLFAPNGRVHIGNGGSGFGSWWGSGGMRGAVYAQQVTIQGAGFFVTYAAPTSDDFAFPVGQVVQYAVESRAYRDIPAS